MVNYACLNCEKELVDKYCSGCGQKADTHRITFRNFLFHDILHGTFHIEKGIMFTAKQSLLRPGKAAFDYISGKRKRYYNVFYFILILVGYILLNRHYYQILEISQGVQVDEKVYINDASRKLDEIFAQKSKIIIFLFIPLAALSSFAIFRRRRLFLSEHFILAGMLLLGMLLISAIGHTFFYINLVFPSDVLADAISYSITTLVYIYIVYGYFNAFGSDYSKLGVAYRIVLFFALLLLQVAFLTLILIGFVTDWKFGLITINPLG